MEDLIKALPIFLKYMDSPTARAVYVSGDSLCIANIMPYVMLLEDLFAVEEAGFLWDDYDMCFKKDL